MHSGLDRSRADDHRQRRSGTDLRDLTPLQATIAAELVRVAAARPELGSSWPVALPRAPPAAVKASVGPVNIGVRWRVLSGRATMVGSAMIRSGGQRRDAPMADPSDRVVYRLPESFESFYEREYHSLVSLG
jgi:hypothetical protein